MDQAEENGNVQVASAQDSSLVPPTARFPPQDADDRHHHFRSVSTSAMKQIKQRELQQHQQHAHTNSLLSSMDNVGLLMREQDADLLESIHKNGPNQTGLTPVLTSSTLDSLDLEHRIPALLSLQEVDGIDRTALVDHDEKFKCNVEGPVSPSKVRQRNQLLPFLPSNSGLNISALRGLSHDLASPTTTLEPISGDHIPSPQRDLHVRQLSFHETSPQKPQILERCVNRRVLSGQIFQVDVVGDSAPTATTDDAIGQVLSPSAEAVEPSIQKYRSSVDEENDSKVIKRTESNERRINEAAQFAEAVGDVPLGDLRIIEDDCCDTVLDDDDDDAIEIHVQRGVTSIANVRPMKPAEGSRQSPNLVQTTARPPPPPIVEPETPVKARPNWATEQQFYGNVLAPRSISTGSSPTIRRASFLAQLPSCSTSSHDFVYKGVRANPPDIVKRGTTRGNYAQLHRKAWLEVIDKYHRYGKHLRIYYRHWESEGCPTNMFFDWLDSKGEAAGQPLPMLEECPRSQLDSDTVLYITNPDLTQRYSLRFMVDEEPKASPKNEEEPRRGRVVDVDGNPVTTGPDVWIFVLRDNVMYGAKKVTTVSGQSKQRFHHSSFFGGKAVEAAGVFITDDEGYLTKLYPHSGHYRPGEAHMQRVLFFLYHEGVDLRTFEMDMQQILHVARDGLDAAPPKDKTIVEGGKAEKKKTKIESLHLMPAVFVACFLAHKARFIGEGIFAQLHQIRKSDVASVTEALAVIDNRGFWRKNT